MKSAEEKKAMVEAAFECLPENLKTEEISALLMTVVDTYMGEDRTSALSVLLTTTMVYARTIGMPDSKMAVILRGAAEHLEEPANTKKVH